MKRPKFSRRTSLVVFMALLAAIVVALAVYFGLQKYGENSNKKEVSETTRQSLMDAGCDDSALDDLNQAFEAKRGTGEEGGALQDLASCYEFRNDYDQVRSTYESLVIWQEANGQAEAAQTTRDAIAEIDFRRDFEENPPVIDEEDEIWSGYDQRP